jgi:hypothetical protein
MTWLLTVIQDASFLATSRGSEFGEAGTACKCPKGTSDVSRDVKSITASRESMALARRSLPSAILSTVSRKARQELANPPLARILAFLASARLRASDISGCGLGDEDMVKIDEVACDPSMNGHANRKRRRSSSRTDEVA